MSKRLAASTSATLPKKARKVDHDVSSKINEVLSSLKLHRDGLSEESERKLLIKVAPYALSVAQDLRHPMQERVVSLIEDELQKLTASFQVSVQASTQAEAAKDDSHKTHAATLEKIEVTLKEQQACMQSKTVELAMVADGHRTAKRQLFEAQQSGFEEIKAAAMAEAAIAKLDAIPSLDNAVPEVELFLKRMPMTLEESLMISLPMSLSKGQEERNSFDTMVIEQFKGQVAKTREDLVRSTEEGRAAEEARQAAVKQAEEALAATQQELLRSADVFTEAKEAVEASERLETATKQTTLKAQAELKKARHSRESAEADLEGHESVTMATFSFLKLRQEPPPPEPAASAVTEETAAGADVAPQAEVEAVPSAQAEAAP